MPSDATIPCPSRRNLVRLCLVLLLLLGPDVGAAEARDVSGSTFEQPGKLKFKFKERSVSPGDDSRKSSRVKYASLTIVEFGPSANLASDEFRIAMVFAEGIVRLLGTYSVNAKGKIRLAPDGSPIFEDLDDFVLGGLKKCKVKAKFKIVDQAAPRLARTKVKTRCRRKGVKPPQKMIFSAKGKGAEIIP